MKKYWIYLCGLLLISSCKKDNSLSKNIISEFPSPLELKGNRIFANEYSLAQIVQLDSLILISTTRDTMFHIYNKNRKKITRFGRKGRGPNELTRTFAIENIVKKNSVTKAFILDEIRKELVTVNLAASIDSNKLIIEKRTLLPDKLQGALDFLFINPHKFIGIYDDHFSKQLDERRGGFYYYPGTGKFKTFDLLNLDIDPYNDMAATNINARMPAISQDRSKIAIAMMHFPKITILNLKDSTQTSYVMNSNQPAKKYELKDFKRGNITEYYPWLYTTNNYIYLLYSGYLMKQQQHSNKIQVLDWNGKPHMQYIIPAKYNISMFVVDEENKEFYGLSYPNDAIYSFDYSFTK